jgi:D-galactarolactone isomerase
MTALVEQMKQFVGACDCHMHVYDDRFATMADKHPPERQARAKDYQFIRDRLGLSRVVVVQSTAYGTDNRCTLDAMKQWGERARGVACVDPQDSDEHLLQLHAAGMRAQRYVMFAGRPLSWDSMSLMASRIKPLGWNINLQLSGEALVEKESLLKTLACDLVIDHIGRFTAPVNNDSPGVKVLHRLLDSGKCWVKLSAPYHGSKSGAPDYADIGVLAHELIKRWPERLLFATNWPHPSVKGSMPDDFGWLNLFWHWVQSSETRQKILVDNPQKLYFDGLSLTV